MGYLYELISTCSAVMTPYLYQLGIHNLHFIDAIVMFLVIPFLHLTNDDDTKAIICEENWYQGIRHMLGIYKEKVPQSAIRGPPSVADTKNKSSLSHNESLTNVIPTSSSRNRFLTRRCNSTSTLSSPQMLAATERNDLLQRRYSLGHNLTERQSISFHDPITRYLITSIKATTVDKTTTMSHSNYLHESSSKGSMTSLQTIYLD